MQPSEIAEPIEFRIPSHNFAYLEEKVAKLNKKAVKLNCEPIVIEILREETEMIPDPDWDPPDDPRITTDQIIANHPKIALNFKIVVIHGESPKLNGWQFVATLQPFEKDNLVKVVPGMALTELEQARVRSSGTVCDYCHINRQRNETYLVRNESNEFAQVGSSCLKDFLGHPNPQMYAGWAEALYDLFQLAEGMQNEDRDYSGGGGYTAYAIEDYLRLVSVAIRTDGWLSRGQARNYEYEGGKTATADIAWSYLTDRRFRKDYPQYGETGIEDDRLVEASLEWARNWLPENYGDNDYLWNLYVATKSDVVDYRTIGIAASLVSAYMRHMEQEIKRMEFKKISENSEWVGEIKKRQPFQLTVTNINYLDSDFGVTILYSFLDNDGNIIKYFSSRTLSDGKENIVQGDKLELVASVKKHDEYHGIKQTLITRGKINWVMREEDNDNTDG